MSRHTQKVALLGGLLVLLVAAPARADLFSNFNLPPSLTWVDEIVAAPDGAMWFTQEAVNAKPGTQLLIGRITTAGAISTRPLPRGTQPRSLVVGADGALLYTGAGATGAKLGRIAGAAITEVPLTGLINALDAVVGPDGALWFTAVDRRGHDRIGRVAADGKVTTFPDPGLENIDHIASGPGRAVWVGLDGGVGRVGSDGRIRRFKLPIDDLLTPDDIVAGPGGALWMTDSTCGCILRMTTAGRVRSFRLPAGELPESLAVGSDGAIWYSGLDGVGRMTMSGEVTVFPLPDLDLAGKLATGPDRAMWFPIVHLNILTPSDLGASRIGRIEVAASAGQLLVVRLAGGRLRGRAGRTLRIPFATTLTAGGSVQLRRNGRVVARKRIPAGATTASVRLPRRPGSYRAVVRLDLPSQYSLDEAPVHVTAR